MTEIFRLDEHTSRNNDILVEHPGDLVRDQEAQNHDSQESKSVDELLVLFSNPGEESADFEAARQITGFIGRLPRENRKIELEKVFAYFQGISQLRLRDLYLLGSLLAKDNLLYQDTRNKEVIGRLSELSFSSDLGVTFTELAKQNNHEINAILHTSLRPIEEIVKLQTKQVEEEDELNSLEFSEGVFQWAKDTEFFTKNYLLRCRIQDLLALSPFNRETQDQEWGDMRFGETPEMVFGVRSLPDSHLYREAMKITDTHIVSSPITELSSHTMVRYQNGQVAEIYQADVKEVEQWVLNERKTLEEGSPSDFSEKYTEALQQLRRRIESGGYRYHDSSEQLLSQEFLDEYFREHPSDYIDILEFQRSMHNQVSVYNLAEILMHNEDVFVEHANYNTRPEIHSLTPEEHFKRLFPYTEFDMDKYNEYLFYVSPAMRERYLNEVGIDISQLPEYAQVWFMDYLNRAKMDDITVLSHVLKHRKNPEIANKLAAAFFACAENESYSGDILKLAINIKDEEDLSRLLGQYLSMVDRSQEIERQLYELFPKEAQISELAIVQTARILQRRANMLLHSWAENIEIVDVTKLERINQDVYTKAQALKSMKRVSGSEFKDVLGARLETYLSSELTPELREEILNLQFQVRSRDPEYTKDGGELLDDLQRELAGFLKHGSNTTFKLQYIGDELVGFIHIHPDEHVSNVVWMGGLNVHPDAQRTPVTEALTNEVRNQYIGKIIVKLEVLAEKRDLQRFYGSLGFEKDKDVTGQIVENKQAGRKFIVMTHPVAEARRQAA